VSSVALWLLLITPVIPGHVPQLHGFSRTTHVGLSCEARPCASSVCMGTALQVHAQHFMLP
jgi:hypothetical protein